MRLIGIFLLLVVPVLADDSFLKDGDRWLFIGDSITHNDTYRQIELRTLQHYHPDADIQVGNSAVNGVTSDYKEQSQFTPTVVTIMLGMNDVIHEDWPFNPDVKPKVDAYRQAITEKVRQYRKIGAEVILMTPTYTDERFSTVFNVAMTRRFLEAFGRVVREVAAAEGCHWLPVAEELEAYQDTLGIDQHVRHDGVHPFGLGQYQIARTLLQHMNFAGTLDGSRKMVTPVEPLDIQVRLASRFMHQPSNGVTLALSAAKPETVSLTWSLGKERGVSTVEVAPSGTIWRVPVPEPELTIPVGSFKRMVVEIGAGDRQRLCIIDLARTRVLKPKDGVAGGEIRADADRPEGRLVGTWQLEDKGSALWFSGEVMDSEIVWQGDWPWSRDGVQIWLDLRPADRFADIGIDRDVASLFLTVRDQPQFCVSSLAWVSPRMTYAMFPGGEKTARGYRWHCGLEGKVSDVRSLGLGKRDYIGFNLIVCDRDKQPADNTQYFPLQRLATNGQDNHPNLMLILDRKNIFPGDETTNLHMWP